MFLTVVFSVPKDRKAVSQRSDPWLVLLPRHLNLEGDEIPFSYFRSIIPPKATAPLLRKLYMYIRTYMFSFFNVRGEQMLSDEISLADSFVSDA